MNDKVSFKNGQQPRFTLNIKVELEGSEEFIKKGRPLVRDILEKIEKNNENNEVLKEMDNNT